MPWESSCLHQASHETCLRLNCRVGYVQRKESGLKRMECEVV